MICVQYIELMEQSDEACLKSIEFTKKGDIDLANFWKNASIGFKKKARSLTMRGQYMLFVIIVLAVMFAGMVALGVLDLASCIFDCKGE